MLGTTIAVCLTVVVVTALICVFSFKGCVGKAKIDLAKAESIARSEYALRSCKEEEITRLQKQIEKMLEKQPTVAIKNV